MKRHLLLMCLVLLPGTAVAQSTATITANAPIYIAAEVTQTPLRVAAPGTQLKVLQIVGDWLQVEFNDPQFGTRVGWVQRTFVALSDASLRPMDLSVPETAAYASQTDGTGGTFPGTETAFGWSFIHWSDFDTNSPWGWNVSVASNLAPWVGIVVDASGNYKTELFGIEDVDGMLHAVLGGPRFSLRVSPVVVPFVQFLAGYVRSDASVLDEDFGSDDLGIQPGGGVDIGGETVAGRIEVGWRTVFYEDDASTQFRLVLGVVIRSGARR